MGVLQAVSLPVKLRQVLEPLLKEVESLTERIQDSDREIEQIARRDYPETALLQQVGGVGLLIALTFILTIEDKGRFQKSRDRLLRRPAAAAQRLGAEPTTITNHKGGRPVPADDAGARSALHPQPPGTGYRFTAMGPAPGETWRLAWQEESGGSGGA